MLKYIQYVESREGMSNNVIEQSLKLDLLYKTKETCDYIFTIDAILYKILHISVNHAHFKPTDKFCLFFVIKRLILEFQNIF